MFAQALCPGRARIVAQGGGGAKRKERKAGESAANPNASRYFQSGARADRSGGPLDSFLLPAGSRATGGAGSRPGGEASSAIDLCADTPAKENVGGNGKAKRAAPAQGLQQRPSKKAAPTWGRFVVHDSDSDE